METHQLASVVGMGPDTDGSLVSQRSAPANLPPDAIEFRTSFYHTIDPSDKTPTKRRRDPAFSDETPSSPLFLSPTVATTAFPLAVAAPR
jgi:hypothetical protein